MGSDFWGSLDAMSIKDQGNTTMKAVPVTEVEDQTVKDQDPTMKAATATRDQYQNVTEQDTPIEDTTEGAGSDGMSPHKSLALPPPPKSAPRDAGHAPEAVASHTQKGDQNDHLQVDVFDMGKCLISGIDGVMYLIA